MIHKDKYGWWHVNLWWRSLCFKYSHYSPLRSKHTQWMYRGLPWFFWAWMSWKFWSGPAVGGFRIFGHAVFIQLWRIHNERA